MRSRPNHRFYRCETFLLAAVALAGCGTSTPAPPYQKQTTSAYSAIPYAPPPARVEIIPAQPKGAVVWIDGEWSFRGKRWRWIRGRWTTVPSGSKFCPWASVRAPDGTFYMSEGHFCDPTGQDVPAPTPLAYATDVGGSVIDQDGNPVETGRALPANIERKLRVDRKKDDDDGDAGVPRLPRVPSTYEATKKEFGDDDAGSPPQVPPKTETR